MLSERNWKLDSVLRLLMGILLCFSGGALLVMLLPGSTDPKATPSIARIFISAICFHGGMLALTWKFLREHQTGWQRGFGLNHSPSKTIGLGLLGILLFLPIGWSLQFLGIKLMTRLGLDPSMQTLLLVLKDTHSPIQIAGLAIIIIFLAPIAEESLFRGVLYPAIKQSGYPRLALWVTSGLFAAIHLNLAAFVPLLLLSVLLVWLYEKTDNLLAPIAAHVAFNAINFGLFFLAKDFANKLPAQS